LENMRKFVIIMDENGYVLLFLFYFIDNNIQCPI
jgi:hypothetical protein